MAVDWTNLIGDGAVFLGISVVLAALGVGCFGARTYTSWQCTNRFLWDYWLSLLTFVRGNPDLDHILGPEAAGR